MSGRKKCLLEEVNACLHFNELMNLRSRGGLDRPDRRNRPARFPRRANDRNGNANDRAWRRQARRHCQNAASCEPAAESLESPGKKGETPTRRSARRTRPQSARRTAQLAPCGRRRSRRYSRRPSQAARGGLWRALAPVAPHLAADAHAAASVGDERPSGGEIAPAGVQARLAASPCPARGNSECESSIDLGWRTPTLLKQRERGSAQRRAFCIRGQSAAESWASCRSSGARSEAWGRSAPCRHRQSRRSTRFDPSGMRRPAAGQLILTNHSRDPIKFRGAKRYV